VGGDGRERDAASPVGRYRRRRRLSYGLGLLGVGGRAGARGGSGVAAGSGGAGGGGVPEEKEVWAAGCRRRSRRGGRRSGARGGLWRVTGRTLT
jgi:hypothetical protein